jgi:hypothetical protein
MKRWFRLCIYILTAILIVCGTVILFLRGVIPSPDNWRIIHETDGDYYIRIESGEITADHLGQYISIGTTRQHLNVYIDGEVILSSCNYGYSIEKPRAARYKIKITEELIGKEMQIVLSTPYPQENLLMKNSLSFERINEGFPILIYSVTAIFVFTGLAALIFAFIIGIRKEGSGNILLFALMKLLFAFNTIRGDAIGVYNIFEPRLLYFTSYISFFIYMLPMLVFIYITLTGKWKKCALGFIILTVSYAVAAVVLDLTRIIPLGLTNGGYNYVLALSVAVLTVMLALQPTAKTRFSIIARIHLVLWTAWGFSAAIRLLVFDMKVNVNIEYWLMYGFTLISLMFFGVFIHAGRINELQKREYIISMRAENLMKNYDQIILHLHEVNILKHGIKNHLTALHILLKDNRQDEAKAYLEKYTYEVDDIVQTAYHENYLINAVVHDMLCRAKESDIQVILDLKASPGNIAEPDLISLLTNIADNALEACAKLPQERKKFIHLTITRRNPYLTITCENSKSGEILKTNSEICSDKQERGHGYGLKTIEKIVNSYDGIMDITYDEDTFTISLAVKDERKK